RRPTRLPARGRRGRSPLLLELLDLLPRARVEDVVLRQPRPPRLADAQLDVPECADAVAVGVDHDLQAGLAGGARVYVREVEPVRLRVDLQERPRLDGLLDHALEIDRGRPATADLAVRDVADAIDVRALHRRQHAVRWIVLE